MIASKAGILNRILGRTGVTTKLENLQADSVLSPDVSADNYLINGGMDFAQRIGTGNQTTSQTYGIDRWWLKHNHTAVTISRQNITGDPGLNGTQAYARITNTTRGSGTYINLMQVIETMNVIPFVGKTITFSIYLRKSSGLVSGNMMLGLIHSSSTDVSALTMSTGALLASKTITNGELSTNWLRYSLTALVPFSARTIAAYIEMAGNPTDGQNVDATQAMLNIGSVAAPFIRAGKTIGGELALCQRYFCNRRWSYVGYVAGNAGYLTEAPIFPYPVIMRRNPDLTELSLSVDLLNTPTYSTSANEYLRVSLSRDTAGGGSAGGNIAADAEL
jgi:hypothetical protein